MTRRTLNGPRSALVHPASLGLLLGLAASAGCATTAPRGAEKEAKPADVDSLKNVGGKANALIVWASSRAGGSHLFTMKSDGSDINQLTKGALTDWNPRFSPDGSKILFSRSVAKGTHENDVDADHAWNLFTIAADGGEPTKVAGNAVWGSWISNDEILFARGSKIMRAKLGGGEEGSEEKKVMDLAKHSIFAGAVMHDPELSKSGHEIAMSLTGSRRQVGVWSLKKKSWTQLGSGSQTTWTPDGAAVMWVSPTGKELSEIVRMPVENGAPAAPAAKGEAAKDEKDADESADEKDDQDDKDDGGPKKERLVDLPGKRSREAFPHLSSDGKWLVFGATIESTVPDFDDYEIYLWEVGSSVSPTRLTFHSASDRWPDIRAGEPGKGAEPKGEEAAPPKSEEGGAAAEPVEKKADKPEGASEPADKGEAEKKDEAGDAAEPPTDESAEPSPAKAKPKAKAGKKKKH